MAKIKVRRLYQDFHPESYELSLTLKPAAKTFSGAVLISGERRGRPSRRLTFHQNGLAVKSAAITHLAKTGKTEIDVDRINLHKKFNELRLHTKQLLYPGKYAIKIVFSGKISRQMNGLYPSDFTYQNQPQQLLATQFESHHAREVFPCIDEPEAKAVFSLDITTDAAHSVVSNTKVAKHQQQDGGQATTWFEPTPKMSTYLLAFVSGNIKFKEAKTKQGVIVRTYATPDNVGLTDFGLSVAVKCLELFDDYFQIPYPLDKCDLIALPDFASGAMENWGCITFREQCLLVDPKNSSLANKQFVAMVVAHEIAHQWFGNLVTMRWWTDLWLNEGFASWIEYLAVDKLFPDWQMWRQFIIDDQQPALKLDALANTHPVVVPIYHPDEIRTIFDAISYSKGASLINMLHGYIGYEDFREGLRHYLKEHLYGNTDTSDLWAALEKASKKPVREFMHIWTTQSGFPLLNVSQTKAGLEIKQKRFLANWRPNQTADTHPWPIPLNSSAAAAADLMATAKLALNSNSKDRDAHRFNTDQSGFYRVNYDARLIKAIGLEVAAGKIDEAGRIGLISDVAENVKAGLGDGVAALEFLQNFKQETDYAVWEVVSGFIAGWRYIMDDEVIRQASKPYIISMITKQLQRLGWAKKPADSHFDQLLRPVILALAAVADDSQITKKCRQLFNAIEHAEDLNADLATAANESQILRQIDIDPDLRGVVYGYIARTGNEADFEKLVKLHNTATLTEERSTLSAAITGFRQPKLIQQALKLIKSPDVRLQDVPYWIAYSFINRHARDDTWEWLKSNWSWLEDEIGNDLSFYRMPIFAARAFSNAKFLKAYQVFFEPLLSPALERSYKQGLEIIINQSAWRQRDAEAFRNYFKQFQ